MNNIELVKMLRDAAEALTLWDYNTINTPLGQVCPGELITQAADALESKLPEGMVMVPVEPTEEMLSAAWAEALDENASGVWRDMIQAALSQQLNQPDASLPNNEVNRYFVGDGHEDDNEMASTPGEIR